MKGFFLEGSAPAVPKNFGASGDAPSSFVLSAIQMSRHTQTVSSGRG